MNNRRKTSPVKLIIVLLVVVTVGFAGYRFLAIREADKDAEQVLDVMYDLIPGLGVDTGVSTGAGRDPLLTLSINNTDIVGCLEIPSLDLMVPVTVKDQGGEGFASVVSGSPVKGKFMLEGDRDTTFIRLAKAQPGAKVVFTDIDGVRYNYSVTTQFHLKDWDEADNDLMVTYRSDDQTRFVLGCARDE
jgi:sortase (surface protein transpeptidase)